MFVKNKIRLLFFILILTFAPIFECKQMHLVNTSAIVNTMVETARVIQAIAAYFVLKYKNDVAVQQIKSIEQNDQKSYQRLIDTHKNLVDNISGMENISKIRLKSITVPESTKQTIPVDSGYISDPTYRHDTLEFNQNRVESSKKHPAIVSFTNKMSEIKSDLKQNRMFELIAKNVHKIVEQDLFPITIPYQQIKDFTGQCIKQMGDYGSGLYVGIREHADRSFSKFAENVWVQEDRSALITKRKMEENPEYKQDIENRLEGISKILIASNSPATRLTDRVKCRLLLPHLNIEFPFKHAIFYCQDNIIEKYFHSGGKLKEDIDFSKKTSAYIANFVEELFGVQRRNSILGVGGLAHGYEIRNDRTTRSGFKNFAMGANRRFKSIFLGRIWGNAKNNRYNKDFLQLIEHCEDFNFNEAKQILRKYDSELMRKVYDENYQPFQEIRSRIKAVNNHFRSELSKASNDLEISEIVLNQITDLSGKNINPKSIDLAIETIKSAGGTEISNQIIEILNKHKLSDSGNPQGLMQAFASETKDLQKEIMLREVGIILADLSLDIAEVDKDISTQGCFRPFTCGILFDNCAIRSMCEKNIFPVHVLKAIRQGGCFKIDDPDYLIFSDSKLNLSILLNKKSKTVTHIGCFNDADNIKELKQLHFNMQAISDGKQEIKEKDSKQEVKTVEDILKDAERKEDSDYAKHYEKDGGFEQAIKDFESLHLSDIKYISPEKRVGKLPDGRSVNIRIESKEGRPTLEVFNPKNQRSIKIRYN